MPSPEEGRIVSRLRKQEAWSGSKAQALAGTALQGNRHVRFLHETKTDQDLVEITAEADDLDPHTRNALVSQHGDKGHQAQEPDHDERAEEITDTRRAVV